MVKPSTQAAKKSVRVVGRVVLEKPTAEVDVHPGLLVWTQDLFPIPYAGPSGRFGLTSGPDVGPHAVLPKDVFDHIAYILRVL